MFSDRAMFSPAILFGLFLFLPQLNRCETETADTFPSDFLFGVSTSAYQIEGGTAPIYGKGENVWDHHIKKNPFIIHNKSNADVACDSYHKYGGDVELVKYLGANFYRFSISWSRILPNGYSNQINMQAIRYYNDIINLLLKNGIEPMITIYHRDLPEKGKIAGSIIVDSLQDLGGWTNPYIAYYFEDYARIAFTYFGDRVKYWITFNSWCYGYGDNEEPPFINQPGVADYLCQNVMLLAHAKAYHLYDQTFRRTQRGQIGITIEKPWMEPASNSSADREAAERARQFTYGLVANPIFHPDGDYPEAVRSRVMKMSKKQGYIRSRLPELSAEEIEYIQGTYDFFGLNYYTTFLVRNKENHENDEADDVGVETFQNETWKKSASSWLKSYPNGLRNLLLWIKKQYDNPDIIITENGFSDHGTLNDISRIEYLKGHLNAILESINRDKVPVRGYSIWSLLDNFEWMKGYSEKFGLFHVDFNDPNLKRTAKLSAKWYKNVISSRNLQDENTSD